MASSEKAKPQPPVPFDLLPVIREAGALTDRQFAELKAKVLAGDYPAESTALAARLVRDDVLTDYQVKRFLAGKSHGLVVGRYVIVDRLGSGSMGRVYKAHHQMMDRYVALKIIAPEIATNEKVVARFQREMKLVGRLNHPNVVRAYDADRIGKVLYIVMEYAQGRSLTEILRGGVIPPLEMADYAAQAALGLGHAHDQGVVHRDVKPSNIIVTDDRQVKVLDLGLGVLMEADSSTSFATADGVAVGTIDYMSPEQALGREVDGRSDLFSLGCATYHLITGRLPYPGDTPIDRMGKRLGGKPVSIGEVRPDTPAGLVRVMDKLLAHKPADRFQTAAEAAEALQALTRPRPRSARPAEPAPPSAPVVVHVEPEYPRWFRPLARLAADRPALALGGLIGAAALCFGAGSLAAWLAGR